MNTYIVRCKCKKNVKAKSEEYAVTQIYDLCGYNCKAMEIYGCESYDPPGDYMVDFMCMLQVNAESEQYANDKAIEKFEYDCDSVTVENCCLITQDDSCMKNMVFTIQTSYSTECVFLPNVDEKKPIDIQLFNALFSIGFCDAYQIKEYHYVTQEYVDKRNALMEEYEKKYGKSIEDDSCYQQYITAEGIYDLIDIDILMEISKTDFLKRFPDKSLYGLDNPILLEDGAILLSSEWNGYEYHSDGHIYRPYYLYNTEIIGYYLVS